MYPTELIKLTMSNAEYPAGKAMILCAYTTTSVQVCLFSAGVAYYKYSMAMIFCTSSLFGVILYVFWKAVLESFFREDVLDYQL